MALELIHQAVASNDFDIKWIGCDHAFLRGLPDSIYYFAAVKEIALSDDYSLERKWIAEGAKGPIYADIKVIKAVACRSTTRYGNYLAPEEDVWLYIRRYDDGKLKYFLSDALMNPPVETLDQLATKRRAIEQCFQECKSYIEMSHYETRTYTVWHRHMFGAFLCALIALVMDRVFNWLVKQENE